MTREDIMAAAVRAQEAFWLTFAAGFPEITSGDLDPLEADEFRAACQYAAESWVAANAPLPLPPADEQFAREDIERVGWLVLYWSGIPAQDRGRLYEFIEAIGNSSVPEACGAVAAGIA